MKKLFITLAAALTSFACLTVTAFADIAPLLPEPKGSVFPWLALAVVVIAVVVIIAVIVAKKRKT